MQNIKLYTPINPDNQLFQMIKHLINYQSKGSKKSIIFNLSIFQGQIIFESIIYIPRAIRTKGKIACPYFLILVPITL